MINLCSIYDHFHHCKCYDFKPVITFEYPEGTVLNILNKKKNDSML